MPDYTVWQWILFFFIYCFFGWCFETALVSIEEKHFVNRGFLRSPFLPIYGFGSLVMILAGQDVYKRQILHIMLLLHIINRLLHL